MRRSISKKVLINSCQETLKQSIYSLIRVQRNNDEVGDVAIFTSRRSGGTWLLQIFGSQKDILPITEPISLVRVPTAISEYLPFDRRGQNVTLDSYDVEDFNKYISDILSGDFIINAPWNIFDASFSFFPHRIVLKICASNCLYQWFQTNTSLDFIYLTRHPISQALSCLKKNYKPTALSFIQNHYYQKTYLNGEQIDKGLDTLDKDKPLKVHVLSWILENIPILHRNDDTNMIHLTYEELVKGGSEFIDELGKQFQFQQLERAKEAYGRPSKTTRRQIKHKLNEEIVGYWLEEVSEKEKSEIQDLLNIFDVDLYTAFDSTPRKQI